MVLGIMRGGTRLSSSLVLIDNDIIQRSGPQNAMMMIRKDANSSSLVPSTAGLRRVERGITR